MVKINKCRICGNTNLLCVLDLGEQVLTGVFPKTRDAKITKGPLRLVKCIGMCGLLQLEHSYDSSEMYGENYGYRSGLNPSMVAHLQAKVARILKQTHLLPGDIVVDIGSNDGTTLRAYPAFLTRMGFDPAGAKFAEYYPEGVQLVSDFFSAELLKKYGRRKVSVITSFSMFYDLEDPTRFMRDIYEVLADDGIWVFEQSYMPSMLQTGSYDTVCHEHLEFYALKQIAWMADLVGFVIRDVELNDVNGGSISVTLSKYGKESEMVKILLDKEGEAGYNYFEPFLSFAKRAEESKLALLAFLRDAQQNNKTVMALGASTKGNVLLQYCGLTEKDISCIGEVNCDKVGSYTPGTGIPIVSEAEVLAAKPDFLIVLPWHFKKFFLENWKYANQNLIFPLPKLETT
jgi:NDP-4-keto-2,6-dideoxyhexose 3-C-methyltransferase